MNIPKNTRTHTRKTEKRSGKNIFRKTRNCLDKSLRIDNFIKFYKTSNLHIDNQRKYDSL